MLRTVPDMVAGRRAIVGLPGAARHATIAAHAQAYLRGIAGAELVVLPRCGHLPHAEQPEALGRAVLSYLARLGS